MPSRIAWAGFEIFLQHDISSIGRTRRAIAAFAAVLVVLASVKSAASATCPDEQQTRQVPGNLALCDELEPVVRQPSSLSLDEYEAKLGEYLRNFCHRDLSKGWKVDKRLRNTGPFIGPYQNGKWSQTPLSFGTHAPVLVWYSPEMYRWLKANRPETGSTPAQEDAVPDGAMMVKEMYPPPAARCAEIAWERLRPISQGAAVMVRDSRASHDGWFWGSFDWTDTWQPDWPNQADARKYPYMGFGLFCTNCHSSAKNATFAAPRNIQGEPGEPLAFLSQNWQGPQNSIRQLLRREGAPQSQPPSTPDLLAVQSLHQRVTQAVRRPVTQALRREWMPSPDNPDFLETFQIPGGRPTRAEVQAMPSETYDHVWAKAGERTAANQFLTSDQCLGCHSAGGTGLQLDMTERGAGDQLINISPYGSWRGSPMGLSGRDPFFFAQLASETQVFHPQSAATIEDSCLGCHGVMGQRQFAIDRKTSTGHCEAFRREALNAVSYPRDHPLHALSNYGALARDGVSCGICHQMAISAAESAAVSGQPQNGCIAERQRRFNPGLNGFAKTFSGSFLAGSPAEAKGPFSDSKRKSMLAAIGIDPVHDETIKSSEICGSCHTVHLPVLQGERTVGRIYEQTTYPEWAFSAFRTGMTPDGPLPAGAGAQAQSCQDCHMPDKDAQGGPYRSKIAAIQEYSNFPQAEHMLPPQDLDLPVRPGFAKHTLVGLNVFLMKMGSNFPDILGIRGEDPMLSNIGVDSIVSGEREMTDQAENRTATIRVGEVRAEGGALNAQVTVVNRTGHKFPSGVGMRRAFIHFEVFDAERKLLWSSGRTNGAGVIIDQNGSPIAGELWWESDCSARIKPMARMHQPHYEAISRQDQAQIYEQLVSAPSAVGAPRCGPGTPPAGELTTSFLSQCTRVKDNRLLPQGFLDLNARRQIAAALGAGADLAEEAGAAAVGEDPDYRSGGRDAIIYRVPVSELAGKPAAVQATLYYQATPPYYLQDRFCTARGDDTRRLYYLADKLPLAGTPAEDWKLRLVTSGPVEVP